MSEKIEFQFSDDFLGGFPTIGYPKAFIGNKLVNLVFAKCNKRAEGVESWSKNDGTVYKDVSYGEYKQNQFNMYLPKDIDKSKSYGVLLCIHGGQWMLGDKQSMNWLARRAAKHGFIGVTMGYSLNSVGNDNLAKATGSMPDATIFTMLDDIDACIKAIKAKCNTLGIKVNSIALTGESAGSHLSMLYAYSKAESSAIPVRMVATATCPVSLYFDAFTTYDSPEAFAEIASATINQIVTVEQVTKKNTLMDSISPITFINENTVPTLMAFAGKDMVVGMNQFPTIEPLLIENNVPYEVIWFEHSDHTLDKDPGTMKKYTDRIFEWMKKYC